jgi:rod shape determining protein RodA
VIDRRLLKNLDYRLLLIVFILSLYGLLIISSASQGIGLDDSFYYVRKQIIGMLIGLVAMIVVLCIDYINFYRWSWYLYACNLIFLGLVLFIGSEGGGAYRWIDLRVFDFQPSELAKFIIIITLAALLLDYEDKPNSFSSMLVFLFHVLVPMVLIFLQPDLGTALVFIVIFFGMLYFAGISWRYLLPVVCTGLALLPFLWTRLLPYQKMRLVVFFNPELDPLGYGYQLKQSMIAIGSGGVTGKGIYQGTQAGLRFLPEPYTDFIFSVLGEELGFLGAVFLLFLYFLLIYHILKIGSYSKDTFGAYICVGVAAMLVFQILVNIGMTLSIMPVTGIPLPFMSYGGNAMLVNMLSVGIVLNIGMRRHKIQF